MKKEKDKLKVKQIENMCIILNKHNLNDNTLFYYHKYVMRSIFKYLNMSEIEALKCSNEHRFQWLINNKQFCFTFPSVEFCTLFIETLSQVKGLELKPMKLKELL